MKEKLTKRSIDKLKCPPAKKSVICWDTEIKNFGICVLYTGRKQFVLDYHLNGKRRRVTLGDYGEALNLEQAQDKAKSWIGQIAEGKHPEGAAPKPEPVAKTDEMTIAKLCEWYIRDVIKPAKKSAGAEYNDIYYTNMVKNGSYLDENEQKVELSKLLISSDDLGKHIYSFYCSLKSKPATARNVFSKIRRMLTLAEKKGWRRQGSNPCHGLIDKNDRAKETKRQRPVSDQEIEALMRATDECDRKQLIPSLAAICIRGIRRSGWRKSEMMTLQYSFVQEDRQNVHLPKTKTGPSDRPLTVAIRGIIEAASKHRVVGVDYVFPSHHPTHKAMRQHIDVDEAWYVVREHAAKECPSVLNKDSRLSVHLHDLRHRFVSERRREGIIDPIIAKLIGHTQEGMTAEYGPPTDEDIKAAALRVTGSL